MKEIHAYENSNGTFNLVIINRTESHIVGQYGTRLDTVENRIEIPMANITIKALKSELKDTKNEPLKIVVPE